MKKTLVCVPMLYVSVIKQCTESSLNISEYFTAKPVKLYFIYSSYVAATQHFLHSHEQLSHVAIIPQMLLRSVPTRNFSTSYIFRAECPLFIPVRGLFSSMPFIEFALCTHVTHKTSISTSSHEHCQVTFL